MFHWQRDISWEAEVPISTARETSMQTARETSMQTARETSMQTARETSMQTARETSMQTARETSMQTARETSMQTARETSMQTANSSPDVLIVKRSNRFLEEIKIKQNKNKQIEQARLLREIPEVKKSLKYDESVLSVIKKLTSTSTKRMNTEITTQQSRVSNRHRLWTCKQSYYNPLFPIYWNGRNPSSRESLEMFPFKGRKAERGPHGSDLRKGFRGPIPYKKREKRRLLRNTHRSLKLARDAKLSFLFSGGTENSSSIRTQPQPQPRNHQNIHNVDNKSTVKVDGIINQRGIKFMIKSDSDYTLTTQPPLPRDDSFDLFA